MTNEIAPTSSRKTSSGPSRAGDLAQSTPEYIRQLSKQTVSHVPELSPEDAKTMAAVFTRMKSIYGHLWSSNFREESQLRLAQAEWIAAFRRASLSQGDVSKALDWLVTNTPDMPNLPAFLEVARMMKHQRIQSIPRALPKKKTEEELEAEREVALKEMKKIKAILNKTLY